jgi:hypothetical protein
MLFVRRPHLGCEGLLASLLAAGCADGATPSETALRIEVDTVAGVEVVRSHGEPPEWALDTLFAIGGAAATDTTAQFGRVVSVAQDPAGRLYIADQMLSTVRQYAADGTYMRTIGRGGQGPGEYARPAGLALLGDTLMIVDPGNVRIGLFRDGAWAGQWPYPAISGSGSWAFQAGPAEAVIRSYRTGPDGGETVFVPHLFEGPDDSIPARPQLEIETTEPENDVECRGDGIIAFYTPPFAPGAVRSPVSGGLVVESEPVGYRLFVLDAAGDTVRILERVTDDIFVDDLEWSAAVEEFESWRGQYRELSCSQNGLERPYRAKMVDGIYPDVSGRIWVELWVSYDSPVSVFDVFSAEGALLGTVRTPRRTSRSTPLFAGDRLYVVSADSLEVETVWGLRIVGTENR